MATYFHMNTVIGMNNSIILRNDSIITIKFNDRIFRSALAQHAL